MRVSVPNVKKVSGWFAADPRTGIPYGSTKAQYWWVYEGKYYYHKHEADAVRQTAVNAAIAYNDLVTNNPGVPTPNIQQSGEGKYSVNGITYNSYASALRGATQIFQGSMLQAQSMNEQAGPTVPFGSTVPQHIQDLESGVNTSGGSIMETRIQMVRDSNASPEVKAAVIEQIRNGNTSSVTSLIDFFDGPNTSPATPPNNPGDGPGGGDFGGDNAAPDSTATPQRGAAVDRTDYIKRVVRHYAGREATDADIQHWNTMFATGQATPADLHREVIQGEPGTNFRNAMLSGYKGEFDGVIKEMWKDYVGRDATEDELKIHGAAFRNGMTIHEMRSILEQAPEVQAHTATNPVTADEMNSQNHTMAVAEAALANNPPKIDDIMSNAVVAAGAVVDGGAGTTADAPSRGGPDVPGISADTRNKMNTIWRQYTGREVDTGDIGIHGQALESGSKSFEQMKSEVANSPEAEKYRSGVINDVFRSIVGRNPTNEDMRIWQDRLKNGESVDSFRALAFENAPADQAAQAAAGAVVVGSPAPTNSAPPTDPDAELKNQMNRIWSQYTRRNADEGDYAIHLPRLKSGTSLEQLTNEVANSPEALRVVSPNNYSYIDKTFRNYVGRPASRADVETWENKLASGQTTRHGMLMDVVKSDESVSYLNRMNAGYNGEHDGTVNQIWGQYIGKPAEQADIKIHGAAMKGGMSSADLNGYVAQAVGLPAFTQDK